MNIVDPILNYAKTRSDVPALVEGDQTITYHELAHRMRRTAAQLTALGISRGDRVGLCLKDSCDPLVALLALGWIGAVAVPLDWRARPAENARLAGAAGLTLALVEPEAPPVAYNCHVVAVDAAWWRSTIPLEAQRDRETGWHDPFVISASSGSTGDPKLTLMTHLQYRFAVAGMWEVLGLAGRHRYLNVLPLYYSAGRNSCLAHLLRGDCVVLQPTLFDAGAYVEAINRHRATVGVLVPSMLRRVLAEVDGNEPLLDGLTALFATGAPLFADEKRQALRCLTPNFHERYGTSETLVVSVLRPDAIAEHADSVGQPHSLAEIEVVDDDDQPLPPGAVGRLRYRGPGLASALPGQGSTTMFRDGWLYLGELASLDERGYVFLAGRISDVIIRSGAKIYPAEVEGVLCEHPAVADAAVIGHCAAAGEEEMAFAFVVPRKEVRPGQLLAHCRARLTPHKAPRQILLLPELPKNTAGKIDKRALAQRLTGADLNQGSPIIAR